MNERFFMHRPDLGWKALLATGLVPKGAKFLENFPEWSDRPELTLEKLIELHEKEGYQVTVIKGKAFDIYGRPFEGDALVGIKIVSPAPEET